MGTSLRPFVEAGKAGGFGFGLGWRCYIQVVEIRLYGEKKRL